VGSEALLGNFIHARGAYLDFDVFALRADDGGVEGFVAVGLGRGDPVFQSLWNGTVHIGDNGVHLPASGLFAFPRHIDDNAYGKQIVDLFETDLLRLDLIEYG